MTYRRWSAVLGLAAIILAAAQPSEGAGFLDKLKDAIAGEAERDKTHLEEFKADAGTAPCGGDGNTSLMHARVEQGLGVIDDKVLRTYINGVMAKLIAASPYPKCGVRVYVTPHDAAQAVALNDGGILVAIGFLRNLKSEDEVAALLAHELSHILHNHHASDSFTDTQDELLKGMDTANAAGSMLVGFVDPKLKQTLDATTSVGSAVYSISENMIAPAWTSEQEDEADLLGADLLAAAGYNPSAMGRILDVIKVQEALAATVDEERDKLRKQRLGNTAVEALRTTDTSNTLSIIASVAKVAAAAVETASGSKRSHRPAEERKKSVNGYVRKLHKKARRRQYAEAPWQATMTKGQSGQTFKRYHAASEARRLVYANGDLAQALAQAKLAVTGNSSRHAYPRLALSEVRLKQGKRKGAFKNLELAMQRRDAPWQIYRSYSDLQLATGNVKGAVSTVARADKLFGEAMGLAPYAIKVYKQAGNRKKVNDYLDRCASAGKRAHLDICLAEAGISKDRYQKQKLLRGG